MKPRRRPALPLPPDPDLVVIGCSLGGLQALQKILTRLSDDVDVPIAIAQHRHRDSSSMLTDVLQRSTRYEVSDAEDQEPIRRGRIFLAPADYHLLVGDGVFHLSTEGPVHYSRPSIDLLFESAAEAFGERLLGILLTGANRDGASGAMRIRRAGGGMLVQDPKTAEAPAMPTAAIEEGAATRVLLLEEIAEAIDSCCVRRESEGVR
ncbi:MAG TPA: chemotaxis protein CheB [Thermoanaerobaculia bacterium]|nr:chemotaxis protein CheB [Thermoanaerobaculia bacterium]